MHRINNLLGLQTFVLINCYNVLTRITHMTNNYLNIWYLWMNICLYVISIILHSKNNVFIYSIVYLLTTDITELLHRIIILLSIWNWGYIICWDLIENYMIKKSIWVLCIDVMCSENQVEIIPCKLLGKLPDQLLFWKWLDLIKPFNTKMLGIKKLVILLFKFDLPVYLIPFSRNYL